MRTHAITRVILGTILGLLFLTPSLVLQPFATNGGGFPSDFQVGYAACVTETNCVTSPGFSIVSVRGSFIVPKIISCPPTGLQLINYEVGMDSAPNGIDVENGAGLQFGCDQFPFYDVIAFAKGAPVLQGSSDQAIPGDHINVKVTYDPVTQFFTVSIANPTRGWSAAASYTDSTGSALRTVALFILTRSCGSSSCPVPNFGTLKTSGDNVKIATSPTMTTGVSKTLYNWKASTSSHIPYAEVVLAIPMTDSDTSNTLVTLSALSSAKTGFNVIWKAST